MTTLTLPDRTLAYQQRCASLACASKPSLVFLGGFASDMNGSKAIFLDEKCSEKGLGLLRFDYRGHGDSSDNFENGCIGDWFDDALKAFDALTKGPQILIGSSMGGWIGLLLARARPERLAGFVGIAAAPDFTEDMVIPTLTAAQKKELTKTGKTYDLAAPQDHRVPITQKLLDEGKNHLVLRESLKMNAPVRLLQSLKDDQVPWQTALKIAETVSTEDVRITFVKESDHSLSRPQDLALLWETLEPLLERDQI